MAWRDLPGEVHLPGVDLEDVQPGLLIWRGELDLPAQRMALIKRLTRPKFFSDLFCTIPIP